jgi:hypothetical protein
MACNSEVNKQTRNYCVEAFIPHHAEGNLVVLIDGMNFNMYTTPSARAVVRRRASVLSRFDDNQIH